MMSGGVLVPPADPPVLAAAIVALLDDPARRARLGRDGRRINAERFDWSRIVDAYLRLYRGDSRGEAFDATLPA